VQEGLFRAPYFGAFDENHDFKPRGTIYSAEWAYDPAAESYGLLIKVAIWAWAFPEFAQRLLDQQGQQGYVNVSMACLYLDSEQKVWTDGRAYREIHNPVFLACSAITQGKPGDSLANGYVWLNGGPDAIEGAIQNVIKASLDNEAGNYEEAEMKELMEKIEGLFGEQKAELQPLLEAVAKLDKLAEAEAALATAQAEVTRLTTELAEAKKAAPPKNDPDNDGDDDSNDPTDKNDAKKAKADLASAQNELETAKVTLSAAQDALQSATAELETLRAFKAEVETKERQAAQAAQVAARTAEIPEHIATALKKQENGEQILSEWMEQSTEKWEVTKAMFSLVTPKPSMAERSERQGILPNIESSEGGEYAISRWAK
jgi:hypothetical protein